jgi:hypothetical protein
VVPLLVVAAPSSIVDVYPENGSHSEQPSYGANSRRARIGDTPVNAARLRPAGLGTSRTRPGRSSTNSGGTTNPGVTRIRSGARARPGSAHHDGMVVPAEAQAEEASGGGEDSGRDAMSAAETGRADARAILIRLRADVASAPTLGQPLGPGSHIRTVPGRPQSERIRDAPPGVNGTRNVTPGRQADSSDHRNGEGFSVPVGCGRSGRVSASRGSCGAGC